LRLVSVPAGATSDSVKFEIFKTAMGLLPEPAEKTASSEPQN
jgi:hypothetical protein